MADVFAVHVANLDVHEYPEVYDQILTGRKRTEYRYRRRRDGTLDQLRAGQAIVLWETGRAGRALVARCTEVRRVVHHADGDPTNNALPNVQLLYEIDFTRPRRITVAGRRLQGWRLRRGRWASPGYLELLDA